MPRSRLVRVNLHEAQSRAPSVRRSRETVGRVGVVGLWMTSCLQVFGSSGLQVFKSLGLQVFNPLSIFINRLIICALFTACGKKRENKNDNENFQRPFTPKTWLRPGRNLAKTRFRRSPTNHFSTFSNFSRCLAFLKMTRSAAGPHPGSRLTRASLRRS